MTKKKPNKIPRRTYQFVMTGTPQTRYHQQVIVSFKPIKKRHPDSLAITKLSILPTFNPDKQYYTPSFVLPLCIFDLNQCLEQHNKKLKSYQSNQNSQIMIALPAGFQYCSVCQTKFEDYVNHCSLKKHIQSTNRHPAQIKIRKLCKKFRQKHKIEHYSRSQSEQLFSESPLAEDQE